MTGISARMGSRLTRLALVLVMMSCIEQPVAFAPTTMRPRTPVKPAGCTLFMGKGFNSARNKQAEMARKMELAKKKKGCQELSRDDPEAKEEEEAKLREDRAMFAKLLAKSQPPENKRSFEASKTAVKKQSGPSATKQGKTKTTKRNRRKKGGQSKGSDVEEAERIPLLEGDVAARRDFEPLISLDSGKQLGPMGAAQLVPWVPPFLSEYLLVLADPRRQSSDLRQAIQFLTSNLAPETIAQVIVVTSDPNEVSASWMKRAGVETPIRIFSDEKLQWMQAYSAVVDDERWSMSLYLFSQSGVIQKLVRQVDPSRASQLVADIVSSTEE